MSVAGVGGVGGVGDDGLTATSGSGVETGAVVLKNASPAELDQPGENLLEHIEHVFHDVAVAVNRTLHIGRDRKVCIRLRWNSISKG